MKIGAGEVMRKPVTMNLNECFAQRILLIEQTKEEGKKVI
jgi:hypothetical protein